MISGNDGAGIEFGMLPNFELIVSTFRFKKYAIRVPAINAINGEGIFFERKIQRLICVNLRNL